MDELGTRDEIEKCLHCPAEECWDCMRWGREPEKGSTKVRRIDLNKFISMYNAGASVPEMAVRLHINETALYQRISNSFKLPLPKSHRPRIDWTYFADLPETIQANLKWRRPT